MKTSQRHQLKTNDFADVIGDLTHRFQENRKSILGVAGLVIAVLVIGGGYWTWRTQQAEKAAIALADAMAVESAPVVPAAPPAAPGQPAPPAPPAGSYPSAEARAQAAIAKFQAVASSYGSSPAGVAARYHVAALLANTGKPADAEREFRAVIDQAGSGLYGRMARIGLAQVQVQAGQFDPAIATFREMASRADADLPGDGLLMQLGRAYTLAGRKTEALQTYQRILDEFPDSLYSSTARRQLDELKAAGPTS
jgi:predicted negative regulator of RcsB-dependent stress response